MDKQAIFEIIVNHTCSVVPTLAGRPIQLNDSLHALGANSIDRSEIIMLTMESLLVDMPLIEAVRAGNIGELAEIMHRSLHSA